MLRENAPVNLCANSPTENDGLWSGLGNGLVTGFFPATIKAFYVYGVLLNIFTSAQLLVQNSRTQLSGRRFATNFPRYFSAFAICASAIELFGRCLGGINEPAGQRGRPLAIGFNWLALPGSLIEDRNTVVITTTRATYSCGQLINLRNFTAHGQATVSGNQPFIDTELLSPFPQLMGNAIETWWTEITTTNRELCERLARANILPISLNQPITTTALSFSSGAAGTPFFRLDFT